MAASKQIDRDFVLAERHACRDRNAGAKQRLAEEVDAAGRLDVPALALQLPQRRIQETVTLKVQKVVDKNDPEDPDAYTFIFEIGDDPIDFTVTYGIQDRYVDVAEYNQYLEDVQYLTDL